MAVARQCAPTLPEAWGAHLAHGFQRHASSFAHALLLADARMRNLAVGCWRKPRPIATDFGCVSSLMRARGCVCVCVCVYGALSSSLSIYIYLYIYISIYIYIYGRGLVLGPLFS